MEKIMKIEKRLLFSIAYIFLAIKGMPKKSRFTLHECAEELAERLESDGIGIWIPSQMILFMLLVGCMCAVNITLSDNVEDLTPKWLIGSSMIDMFIFLFSMALILINPKRVIDREDRLFPVEDFFYAIPCMFVCIFVVPMLLTWF